MSSLLAAALVATLAALSVVSGQLLAAGVLIAQLVFALGAVRLAPIPAAGASGWLAAAIGAAATGWMAVEGIPELVPMARVLGLAFLLAVVVQLGRDDGRVRVTSSLTFSVTACVLAALPAAWVGLRFADGGASAVSLGLLGVGVAVLVDGLGRSPTLRRLLAVLMAGGLAAGLVLLADDVADDVPAVGAVVIAAFGAVMAVAALAGVDRLMSESARQGNSGPLVVGSVAMAVERAVASAATPLRVALPFIAAAPIVYVLGRILVG